ncbi:hypothetical protein O9992_00210 [Vibrio lentus]|nr:hypothetical protein [Vibrio lentus]
MSARKSRRFPLRHYKSSNYAVFIGKQLRSLKPSLTQMQQQNAAISARLPYIMARVAVSPCPKVMGRDRVGSNLEAPDIKRELQLWIDQYTNAIR